MANRITLNIPHSSINGLSSAQWDSQQVLVACVNELTDWHTDIMFTPDKGLFLREEVTPFVFPRSCFVVDAERLINDDMESIGQGIVYTNFYDRMHRTVSATERETLYNVRADYIAQIEQRIIANDSQGYGNILIDCHSMGESYANVDICIGYNDDASRPTDAVITNIVDIFHKAGYTVGINTPYSNSLQPIGDLSLLQHRYFSFMIELNKKIYLNKTDRTLTDNASHVKDTLATLYHYLLDLS